MTYCLLEINSSKITTISEAVDITKKASVALQDIESDLEMPCVFDKVNEFMDENGISRALRKSGIVTGFDIPYQAIVAHKIFIYKSHSIDGLDKKEWKELYDMFEGFNPPCSYSRFKIPVQILACICRYLSGEDTSATIKDEINTLEEYKKKLEELYAYHANSAFREFISNSREGRVIVGQGAFSLDAIQLRIDNLRARVITKRKDSTILERQLAIDFIDTLHRFNAKQIPSIVSMLMGCGFIKEFVDNRTIFRLWKSFNQSQAKLDKYYGTGRSAKSTTSYKYVYSDSVTERIESLRSFSYAFIQKVGLQGK